MKLCTLLLALMTMLIPPSKQAYNGEAEADAEARYEVISEAIAFEAGIDKRLAHFMLTVATAESHYNHKIHSGKERGDQGRSWSLFQILCGRSPDSEVPGTSFTASQIVGLDLGSTKRAAHAGAFHLRWAIRSCRGKPACVFRRYGGVTKKNETPEVLERIAERVATYRWIRKKAKKLDK